jgi:hypothetical protein
MKRTRPIRWALTGMSVAIAALLIGFTSSSAIAATHANAQQSHPIAATTIAIDLAGVTPAAGAYYPPHHHYCPPYWYHHHEYYPPYPYCMP